MRRPAPDRPRRRAEPRPLAPRPAARPGRGAHRRRLAGRQRDGVHHARRRAAGVRPLRRRRRYAGGGAHGGLPAHADRADGRAVPRGRRRARRVCRRTSASPACSRWRCSPASSCWSLGLLRAGGLVRFISNAVMIGLMAGIGVTILLSQLGALTGFSSRYDNKVLKAADLFMHPGASDVETTVIGLVTVALVVALRHTRLKLFAMALPLAGHDGGRGAAPGGLDRRRRRHRAHPALAAAAAAPRPRRWCRRCCCRRSRW